VLAAFCAACCSRSYRSRPAAWGSPPDVREEILRINDEARHRALQVALLVPILAGALGLATASRMTRRPDPEPAESTEMALA
jgi:hypothetical protein